MASSSSMPLLVKNEEPRNWSELPPELTFSIMIRLDAVEILEDAQKVCRAWRRVSKNPSLWRKIDMRSLKTRKLDRHDLDKMCRNAVDRSEGGLVEISIGNFCTDSLLNYIADRSSNLRSLGLEMFYSMTSNGLVNAVAKLPLLEVLELYETWQNLDLKAIGHSCLKLKTLKLNCSGTKFDDDDALTIAKSMPELRHLQLIGNRLTDIGLNAILDNCPHLEHLDLRKCLNITLSGNLEKRCLEMVKGFRRPNDSTADYPYYAAFYESDEELDCLNSRDVDYYSGGDDYEWY
ncbi:unnamed protein product [Arabis nemorensis]|uniref:F-box domain-containing protein n=1 Tax=Arabis nemorensis TaxID=586526 RepID=A0A565C2K7_9BRAS|nr:unnamed protein product [Arabis nemorensis]